MTTCHNNTHGPGTQTGSWPLNQAVSGTAELLSIDTQLQLHGTVLDITRQFTIRAVVHARSSIGLTVTEISYYRAIHSQLPRAILEFTDVLKAADVS